MNIRSIFIVFTLFFFGIPAQAQESLVVWDDFSEGILNPGKWRAQSTHVGAGGTTANTSLLEVGREVTTSKNLVMLGRTQGGDDTFLHRNLLRFNWDDSEQIHAIQVRLKVREAKATDCLDPAGEVNTAKFRAFGVFYNWLDELDPQNSAHGVWAEIFVKRSSNSTDPEGFLRVGGTINQCTTNCSADRVVLETIDLGTVHLSQIITLRVEYVPYLNQFIFQRDNETEVFVTELPDRDEELGGGLLTIKRLEMIFSTPQCFDEPLNQTAMKVRVDKVWVNESALPGE